MRKLVIRCLLFVALSASSACTRSRLAMQPEQCKADIECDHSQYCDLGTCRTLGR